MYETNIYLTKEDKIKLTKQAHAKQLSLSTYIDIIVENYWIITHKNCFDSYIFKGTEQTHIKLRNSHNFKLTPMIITNAITLFLHKEYNNKEWTSLIDYQNINRRIQSQADRTIDERYNYNQLRRAIYRATGN